MGKNLNQTPSFYRTPKHLIEGDLDGTHLKIGIVCARFNQFITKSLLMGAIEGLIKHNVNEDNILTHVVPGAFEVPVVVEKLLPKVDVVIAIACVIKGDTPHFDYVCQGITSGITQAISQHKKPCIYCVLTTNTIKQAESRAVPHSTANKGYEAALAAIETANLIN